MRQVIGQANTGLQLTSSPHLIHESSLRASQFPDGIADCIFYWEKDDEE